MLISLLNALFKGVQNWLHTNYFVKDGLILRLMKKSD